MPGPSVPLQPSGRLPAAMRTALDGLYRLSGALAALCLLLICLIVAAQVTGRVIDTLTLAAWGRGIGLYVPSAAEFSGFLFAAASFLALASALRHGDHIRVSLFISRHTGRNRRAIEIWCLVFAAAFSAFFAFHAVLLVLDSHAFGEVSVGMVPVPLWIPQGFMAFGLVVLAIAVLDDLVRVLRGGGPSYRDMEGSLADSGTVDQPDDAVPDRPWSR